MLTLATSAAVIAACSCVLETNVVVRALPLNCTTDAGTKFVPVKVIVNAALPATAEPGVIWAIVGGGPVGGARKYPEMSMTTCVGSDPKILIDPFAAGTIARLDVIAPSPAFRVETSGLADP